MKKVSVIIPAYNAATFIAATLQSVFEQTYPKEQVEIIVVNDGSTDNTQQLLESYGKQIHLINTPNRGASAARETGRQAATGDFLQYLDSDDLLMPEKITLQVEALQRENAEVAYGNWLKFREVNGKREEIETINRQLNGRPEIALFTNFWCPPAALLYTKSIADKIGEWNKDLPIIQDARYFLDAALHQATFVYTPSLVAAYRVAAGTSLSQRMGSFKFTKDCYINAKEIYALWQQDLNHDPEKKQALISVFCQCAETLFANDQKIGEECLDYLQKLGGTAQLFASNPIKKIGAKILGVQMVWKLLDWYRKR